MQEKVPFLLLFTLYSLLFTLNCARKAPPPSPDRWAPKLATCQAIDNRHLSLKFSEPMEDTSAQNTDCYTISRQTGVGARGSVPLLEIRAATCQKEEVMLITSPMDSIEYSIVVKDVKDAAGNPLKEVTKKFWGSLVPDTTSPLVYLPLPCRKKISGDTSFAISFSEVIDTLKFVVLPSCSLKTGWNTSHTEVEFKLEFEALDTVSLYTFYGRAYDPSGNSTYFTFSFTRADKLPELTIQGRTEKEALVLLSAFRNLQSPIPTQATLSDTGGGYSFENIAKGKYLIEGGLPPTLYSRYPDTLEIKVSQTDVDFELRRDRACPCPNDGQPQGLSLQIAPIIRSLWDILSEK